MTLATLAGTVVLAASGVGLIQAIVWLVIVGLIFWVLWWFIGYVGVPEPFNKVLRVLLGLVAVIFVINFLLGILGPPPGGLF